MHDQLLNQHILQLATTYTSRVQAQPGTDLYLVIGVHCAANDESMQLHWDIVCRGMLAEQAQRHFDRALFKLKCADCGSRFELTESAPICPLCGSVCVAVVEAEDCYLEAMGQ